MPSAAKLARVPLRTVHSLLLSAISLLLSAISLLLLAISLLVSLMTCFRLACSVLSWASLSFSSSIASLSFLTCFVCSSSALPVLSISACTSFSFFCASEIALLQSFWRYWLLTSCLLSSLSLPIISFVPFVKPLVSALNVAVVLLTFAI